LRLFFKNIISIFNAQFTYFLTKLSLRFLINCKHLV